MVKDKDMPISEMTEKEIPASGMDDKEMPISGKLENMVSIGGTMVEIKPTKLKYMRNRTAEFYQILQSYPLPDILAAKSGTFGDERDGDKCVFDWLVAVFDDEKMIRKYYNDMDVETIEQTVAIFKRVNRIQEKEDKLKNLKAPGKVV